ncbi:NUDIX domain-containing protein [Actinopolymorpha pittospori]|uniref:ADP-ribose pyrophosphatase YjhB (NUDIX family) n=1 Tax=Actinopolymorpha pittospori TaxID=648752 RepID=A0A927MRF2_9ACTN|nr:ADP-ribose pyrophosphatase YjhB (NUDIX family) [Actinopolymorpha pittospori]
MTGTRGPDSTPRKQRVGAYALCQDTRGPGRGASGSAPLLLCRMSARTRTPGRWTLPGGGVRHGEDPAKAVLREMAEETGLSGQVHRVLGVHSNVYDSDGTSIHGVRLLYLVEITGGSPRRERDDTTDDLGWFGPTELDRLDLSAHAAYGIGLLRHER